MDPTSNPGFKMPPLTQYLKSQIYLFALNQKKYFRGKQKLGFILVTSQQTHGIILRRLYSGARGKDSTTHKGQILERKNASTSESRNYAAKLFKIEKKSQDSFPKYSEKYNITS